MNRLRQLPTPRLLALAAAATVGVGGTALAGVAIGGDGPTPPAKPLDRAVSDAVRAPAVVGITARVRFTNGLLPDLALPEGQGTSPLLTGAEGRLWLAGDGRLRLELQSDAGDAQLGYDGRTLTVYDASSNTVYRAQHAQHRDAERAEGPPSLAQIRLGLERLGAKVDLIGPEPGSIAGRPAYTVRVAPKHDGGLLGAAVLAFDADNGVPLRAAVTAQGQGAPVLELAATEIAYGRVAADDLRVATPAGARVVQVQAPAAADHEQDRARRGAREVTGLAAVQGRLDFELAAPRELVGLERRSVRLVRGEGGDAALVTYGRGLGALLVLQQPAGAAERGEDRLATLPEVSIDGAPGRELATALGTVLRFREQGVTTTVAGSLPPAAAEAAARELR